MLFRDATGLLDDSIWFKIEAFELSRLVPAKSSSANDSPIGPVFCRLVLGRLSLLHECWGTDGTTKGSEMAGEGRFGLLGVLWMSW